MMRTSSLIPLLAAVVLAGCDASVGEMAAVSDTVSVAGGRVAGRPVAARPGDRPDIVVRVYRGIPFAAPPVGDLRWRPPEPVGPWDGVRDASEFGPGCIQELAGSRLPWTEEFMHQGEVSEDCLYLNVWTAAESREEGRPVLVYIHGGGFGEGSGSVSLYDGASLARKGLVVVTTNYRLGVLGFLAHPGLTAESPHAASGNYGLLDQVAALEWVQDNAAAFGGDPGNVTIAGQSAGAMSVYLLTASPLAAGLFHRAIVQSGPGGLASFGMTDVSLAEALADAESAGRAFGEAREAESVEALRALPVAELAPRPDGTPARFGPVIDGWFLPADVASVYAAGEQNDVPTLMGFNADEASAFPGYGRSTPGALREMAAGRFGDGDRFVTLYPAVDEAAAGEASKTALRDLAAVALSRVARQRARTAETPAWLYYFERGIPWPEHPEYGAFHSGEVPYVFDNLDRLDRPWEAADLELADAASSYWARFAASGDPNTSELPAWPTFDDAPGTYLVLGEPIEARVLPADSARRAYFEESLDRQ
jgi:para-nitrobenzyl esterase